MNWWSDMVHGYMVYTNTEHAETAAVSCGISHVSTVSTPLQWILFFLKEKKEAAMLNHVSTVSLLESGEQRCIKSDQQLFSKD